MAGVSRVSYEREQCVCPVCGATHNKKKRGKYGKRKETKKA
jgi:hypothetical protein